MASLKLTSATILTMNDARAVVAGDLSIRDGRIAAVGAVDRVVAPRPGHRRRRRAGPARLRADPRAPVPDAVPRARRRPAAAVVAARTDLAARGRARRQVAGRLGEPRRRRAAAGRHDHRPDHGDGARHRRGLRGIGADRPARGGRQVPDGRRRGGAGAAPRAGRTRPRRRGGAGPRGGTARPAAGCRRRSRRASRCRARRRCSRARPACPGEAGLLVHTHAAEQQDEVALVRARTGVANVEYLAADRAGRRHGSAWPTVSGWTTANST